jgi:hypothetical protein
MGRPPTEDQIMPRAQVTAENSQRIFSTAPHHAPCHVSRGLARGRSAAKIALGGSGHHRGVCQLADFVSALPRYTVGPGKTVNLFHTVIHGSSHPRDPTGRSESSRPRCTPQCSSLGCGARRMLNACILEAIEQHVEWLTRRCAHRSHPGYGRIELRATRRAERSKSSIKLPISPV